MRLVHLTIQTSSRIYDVGSQDGAPYVVSELLEGETLRSRLTGNPLGQHRALDYASQIVNGLAAAHEKGIVHHDLKPENIFITNDGRVKILDLNGRVTFSVSDNGVLALRGGALALNQLLWFDRTGKQLSALTTPGTHNALSLSPDQKRVALTRTDLQTLSGSDIWLIDLERGSQIRLTTDPSGDRDATWSPDASRIAFVSTRNGLTFLYQKASSGAGAEESLLASKRVEVRAGLVSRRAVRSSTAN